MLSPTLLALLVRLWSADSTVASLVREVKSRELRVPTATMPVIFHHREPLTILRGAGRFEEVYSLGCLVPELETSESGG